MSNLTDPAPSGEVLQRMLRAALRAPDHGALRPWRILLVRGPARERLGELMAESLRRRRPDASAEDLAREKQKALRAPLIAIVVARIAPSPKAPEIEQVLSAGLVAYGLVLAAQAEGFGAIWRTGEFAYDRWAHERLGLGPGDRIVGIVYLGSVKQEPPEVPRPRLEDHVVEWSGAGA